MKEEREDNTCGTLWRESIWAAHDFTLFDMCTHWDRCAWDGGVEDPILAACLNIRPTDCFSSFGTCEVQ